jgi:signal transduction histidine kinase/CheY-like chemotaxis protein
LATTELNRKRRASMVTALCGTLICAVAGAVAFYRGQVLRGWIIAGVGLISAIAVPLLLRTRRPDRINLPALIAISIFTLYLLVTGGTDNSGALWVTISPPLVLFTLGVRRGGWLTLVFLVAVLVILFFPGDRLLLATYTLDFKLRILPAILFVAAISFVYELAREKAQAGYEREIVERLRAERAAEEASRAKSAFLAKMSHELRTPLNGILGLGALLKEDPAGSESRRWLDALLRSARQLKILIDDLLDLATIEAGRLRLNPVPADVGELCRETVEAMQPAAREKGLSLACRVAPGLPASLRVDRQRLGQVILNLLSNAIKFTSSGEVRLEVEGRPGADGTCAEVSLRVIDQGPGIPPTDREKIFERFWQNPELAGLTASGVGLGLSICREIVAAMGGRIFVVPGGGPGAALQVDLWPEIVRRPSAEPAEASEPQPAPRPGIRVLVADDDATSRELLSVILRRLGAEVVLVADGREAAARAEAERFDAILLDCKMPNLDGYVAARRIRAEDGPGQTVPIVAVTAGVLEEERTRCKAAGMNTVLAKPIETEALRRTMLEVLTDRS